MMNSPFSSVLAGLIMLIPNFVVTLALAIGTNSFNNSTFYEVIERIELSLADFDFLRNGVVLEN